MIRLENTQASHNKFYELHLDKAPGRFTVTGLYGAIGQAPQKTIIYDGDDESAAMKELKKKQLEKEKKGYKIVQDSLSITEDLAKPVHVKPLVITENRDDIRIVWPMNARGVEDDAHFEELMTDDNYVLQEKLDGMRGVDHITNDGMRIFSRNAGVADPTRPLEKTASLPHLAAIKFPRLAGTIMDSEILMPGVDSATLAGNVNSRDNREDNKKVKLYVFDVLQYKGDDLTSLTLEERLPYLDKLKTEAVSPFIVYVPYAFGTKAKRALYEKIMSAGGEGVMFKNVKATYAEGDRPAHNMYKAKKSKTFDCVVMGFTTGKGKYNNKVGALVFGQYVDGELTELGQASGMSDDIREDMTEHPEKYIGKAVVIKAMERLKSGALRHPVYKGFSEKNPKSCVWYQGEQ